jgi:hypothetical protein
MRCSENATKMLMEVRNTLNAFGRRCLIIESDETVSTQIGTYTINYFVELLNNLPSLAPGTQLFRYQLEFGGPEEASDPSTDIIMAGTENDLVGLVSKILAKRIPLD